MVHQLTEGVVSSQPDAVVSDMQCRYALSQVGIKVVKLLPLFCETLHLFNRQSVRTRAVSLQGSSVP